MYLFGALPFSEFDLGSGPIKYIAILSIGKSTLYCFIGALAFFWVTFREPQTSQLEHHSRTSFFKAYQKKRSLILNELLKHQCVHQSCYHVPGTK